MKSMFLSVVVICALVIAGVGGTLADFSDIETSPDNFFKTGALDGKYSDHLGNLYDDTNQVTLFTAADAWPCHDDSYYFDSGRSIAFISRS